MVGHQHLRQHLISPGRLRQLYDLIEGPTILQHDPAPSIDLLLDLHRSIWDRLHDEVHAGRTLVNAIEQLEIDQSFWERYFYTHLPSANAPATRAAHSQRSSSTQNTGSASSGTNRPQQGQAQGGNSQSEVGKDRHHKGQHEHKGTSAAYGPYYDSNYGYGGWQDHWHPYHAPHYQSYTWRKPKPWIYPADVDARFADGTFAREIETEAGTIVSVCVGHQKHQCYTLKGQQCTQSHACPKRLKTGQICGSLQHRGMHCGHD